MAVKFESLMRELQAKQYKPVYLLHGEEPYFVETISDYIENHVLNEAEKGFNQTVLYGKDTEFKQVVDAARRYPMMSQYQVVIVKEAQGMRDLEKLQTYFENPLPSTLLVLCFKSKKLDKRKSVYKLLDKKHVIFESAPLKEGQIPMFINQYLQKRQFRIEERAAAMLTEYLGTELSKVCNELDKLILNCDASKAINNADIEKNIGISREFNVFELKDALAEKNVSKVYKIVNHFAANPKAHPMPFTMGVLYSFYGKLHTYLHYADGDQNEAARALNFNGTWGLKPFQVARSHYSVENAEKAVSLLLEYDLRSKGVNNAVSDHGELLKELSYRLLN